MAAILFDTLAFASELKHGGFTEQQAETQARAIAGIVEKQLNTKHKIQEHESRVEVQILELKRDIREIESSLKHDMRAIESSLKHDIELLRAETKRDIADTKAELVRWVVGVGLLQTSLIIGALMKMSHLL
ncbi:MAG: DUF1640 domain-containing protein [Methylococcales bacterium]|nr:DUF1640 domain-containing protein [Methylococcales bacterium]